MKPIFFIYYYMQILGADFCLALLRWEFPVSFKNLTSIKGVSISLLLFWIEHINGYKLKAYKLQSPSLVIKFFYGQFNWNY